MFEIIYKRLHANNPDAPPYVPPTPSKPPSFHTNSQHIAKFAVKPNNQVIAEEKVTEAFGQMRYLKVVHVLSERVAREYAEKANQSGASDTQQSEENAPAENKSALLRHTTINGTHPHDILKLDAPSSLEITLIHQQKALIEIDRMCASGREGVQRLVAFGVVRAIVDCVMQTQDALVRLLSMRCLARVLRLSFWARDELAKDEAAFFEVYDALLHVLEASSQNSGQALTIPASYECSIELRKSVFDSHLDCVRYVVRVLAVLASHSDRGHMVRHFFSSDEDGKVESRRSESGSRPTTIELLVNRVLKQYKDGVVLIETLHAIHAYVSTHASARHECLQHKITATLTSFLRQAKNPDQSPFVFRYGPQDVHDDDYMNHPLLPNADSEESVNRPFVSSPPYTLMNLVVHTAACFGALAYAKEGTKAAVAEGVIADLVYWMDMRNERIRENVTCALMYLTLDIRGKREAFEEDIASKLRELITNKNERTATKIYLLRIINNMSDLPEARQQLRSLSAYLKTMRSSDDDRAELREVLDECYEKAYACVTYTV